MVSHRTQPRCSRPPVAAWRVGDAINVAYEQITARLHALEEERALLEAGRCVLARIITGSAAPVDVAVSGCDDDDRRVTAQALAKGPLPLPELMKRSKLSRYLIEKLVRAHALVSTGTGRSRLIALPAQQAIADLMPTVSRSHNGPASDDEMVAVSVGGRALTDVVTELRNKAS